MAPLKDLRVKGFRDEQLSSEYDNGGREKAFLHWFLFYRDELMIKGIRLGVLGHWVVEEVELKTSEKLKTEKNTH